LIYKGFIVTEVTEGYSLNVVQGGDTASRWRDFIFSSFMLVLTNITQNHYAKHNL
jgi:hypothetical protein